MNKTLTGGLLLLIVSVVLSSCGGGLGGANSFTTFKKGLAYATIDSAFLISDTDRYPTYYCEFDNQKYQVVVHQVTNWVHKELSMGGSGGGYNNNGVYKAPDFSGVNSGSRRQTTRYKDPFYLIFKDKKLFSWGYLYEFKNDPSNRISQFGMALEDGYKIYLKSKGDDYER